jgi:hypothetical protein
LVGVAVKVTLVPLQIVVADAEILTLAGRFGFTVIVIWFDEAGLPVAQVAFEVISTFTRSPFANVVVVYVVLFVPTAVPFSLH